MAMSGVENLARVPELKKKLLWTFALLAVYRMGIHIPIPGVDSAALADFFANAQNTLFGIFDMFSGGGLSNMSIFALGIMPYISASIILQLLTVVSPELKRLQKEEGEAGRKKITQYTRYLTVLITVVQGFAIAAGLESASSPTGAPMVLIPGIGFKLMTILTLTAGTVFLMWLGEQMTEKGIGNGISMIIYAGIVAGLPAAAINTVQLMTLGEISLFILLFILVFMVATLGFIVFMERGQRRIPIHYAKRQMGRRMFGGQTTHLPLKINTAGVIPPIFASSILMFPATLAQFSSVQWLQDFSSFLSPDSIIYNLLFIGIIIFFCYFYTAIMFDPKGIAENIQKQGGFIPGIRPGARTREYIDKVLARITLWGAFYVSAVCVLPMLLISNFGVPFYFGGTSLLIVVGVAMDFMGRIESYLISRQYEGLLGKAGKGR
ncbi:MAG: preprotein translocase subunit SecY [Pseudodesulfovibrio sp.]|nr:MULTISPECIES: preprotein translocase subunit SecY [Pseudodesulfovibrio]MBU4243281.1 preprotein translocase subunit SecY [Pseudomonadota bacterium]MCG2733023.1 preprotein translocase subunit SecY [Pseudodesulfovibrio aespoeensis]MBU4475137.1 preprotein translocase subunit SecY [Pseudomonadota bacterium]MBU4516189.1 preprotein translocase subunit SecY [Pseudomonadota bacterium]MBU4523560.1 preprotein translocase subunit SecY [Pseudomonadota bacterium]